MTQSFNGAVTFSLRKSLAAANISHSRTVGLQWGRNFFVTEIIDVESDLTAYNDASMGP